MWLQEEQVLEENQKFCFGDAEFDIPGRYPSWDVKSIIEYMNLFRAENQVRDVMMGVITGECG